jgi:excisionase family DNA binding protein
MSIRTRSSNGRRRYLDGDRSPTLRSVERITTAKAARRLGISRTQVHRMIDAGHLEAERETRPQGTRLLVLWDASHHEPQNEPGRHTGDGRDVTRRFVPVEELEWLKTRLERAEEERAELRRLLNMAHQTIAVQAAQLAPPRPEARNHDEPKNEPGTSPVSVTERARAAPETPIGRRRSPSWLNRLLARWRA